MNVNGGGVADAGGKTLGEAALVSGTAEPQTSAAPEDRERRCIPAVCIVPMADSSEKCYVWLETAGQERC